MAYINTTKRTALSLNLRQDRNNQLINVRNRAYTRNHKQINLPCTSWVRNDPERRRIQVAKQVFTSEVCDPELISFHFVVDDI